MAKPTPVASAEEAAALRRRLRRLVAAVAAGTADAEAFDEASEALAKLRDAELGPRKDRAGAGGVNKAAAVPEHFLCPISSEIMRDPVVLASGQTYDRRFIQEWLSAGNRTCPQTQQVLSNTVLIPNHLVRSMVSQWCTDNGITLPPVENQEEDLVTNNERKTFSKLLERITSSSNLCEQREAIKDMRLLTKCNSSLRAAIGEKPDSISQMISVVSSPAELESNAEVLEDMVTTILNLSIHESNKKIIGDDPLAIPFLIRALQSGTMEARSNAAAAIFSLSALDSNKVKIGELGAMRPLVDLLEHGSMVAKKDAASAIFNLCMLHENKSRATKNGVIDVTLKAIAEDLLVDESLAILALLSGDHETVEEIGETGGVASMLRVIKEDQCKRNKENAAAVLFAVCMYDRTKLREVAEGEKQNGSLAWLAQNGTSRARRKATGILEKMKRVAHHTHYSC
ncbi:hypothetical protein U9M48_023439 [Paspalum notatum var. saurae]|uniref:RING-type E3 ubiquitin transferase n=1 Tax=Paspalum notatum var. saurae TaxID=547442 RepID=A0AAQ3TKG4_PASNO